MPAVIAKTSVITSLSFWSLQFYLIHQDRSEFSLRMWHIAVQFQTIKQLFSLLQAGAGECQGFSAKTSAGQHAVSLDCAAELSQCPSLQWTHCQQRHCYIQYKYHFASFFARRKYSQWCSFQRSFGIFRKNQLHFPPPALKALSLSHPRFYWRHSEIWR